MIKHIVCHKLKEGEDANYAKELLLSMKDHIPYIREIEVGVDFLHSDRSYDVILQVVLDSKEDLDRYQHDEYHVNVIKKHMHKVRVSSVSIDYEL